VTIIACGALALAALAGWRVSGPWRSGDEAGPASGLARLERRYEVRPLKPGNEPDPDLARRLDGTLLPDSDLVRIELGTNIAVATATQAGALAIVGGTNHALLTVQRADGGLTLVVEFFGPDATLMGRLEDDALWVDPSARIEIDQPDEGTALEVRDGTGATLLHVRYVNPSWIAIRGRFHHPASGRYAEILDDRLILDGRWTSNENVWIVLDAGPVVSLD
jgi:hypothetical protein